MRRDLRPQSAKCKPSSAKSPVRIHESNPNNPSVRVFKTRSHNPAIDSNSLALPSDHHPEQLLEPRKESKELTSSSKFLKKYENIRAHRSTKNSLAEYASEHEETFIIQSKAEFIKAHTRKKSDTINGHHLYPDISVIDVLNNKLSKKPRLNRSPRPWSSHSCVELPKLCKEDMIFHLEEKKEPEVKNANGLTLEQDKTKTVYWKKENKFVSLFPLEKNDNLNYIHDHILPVYAEMNI
jgi:hypothetical protein